MSSLSHVESLEQRRMMSIVGFPGAAGDVRLLGVADFSADGQDDFVTVDDATGVIKLNVVTNANNNPPTVTPEVGDMGTTTGSATFLAFGVGSFKPGADLDPTHPDLLFWDTSLRMLGWWTTDAGAADGGYGWIDGETLFGAGGSVVASGWTPWGYGDINKDDFDDIIFRNDTTGDIGVWYLTDGDVIGADVLGNAATDWRCVGVADLDDDGTNDILWNNKTSGALVAWKIDSGTYHFANEVLDYGTTASATWAAFAIGAMDGGLNHNDILIENIDTGAIDALVIDGTGTSQGLKDIV